MKGNTETSGKGSPELVAEENNSEVKEGRVDVIRLPETKMASGKHTFEDDEIKTMVHELTRRLADAKELTDRKKSIASEYQGQINQAKNDADQLVRKINDGYEMRDMECFVDLDFENKKKRFYSVATGELVQETYMTPSDMQMRFAYVAEDGEQDDGEEVVDPEDSEDVPGVEQEVEEEDGVEVEEEEVVDPEKDDGSVCGPVLDIGDEVVGGVVIEVLFNNDGEHKYCIRYDSGKECWHNLAYLRSKGLIKE